MKKLIILFLLLALPAAAPAKVKRHIATPESLECSECHIGPAKAWFESAHGLMNVKCVVCHGSTEVNFSPKPGPGRCRGCHGNRSRMLRRRPEMKRAVFSCHDQHSLTLKKVPNSPFHEKGGNQP